MKEDNIITLPFDVLTNTSERIKKIFENMTVERYPEGFLLITEFIEKILGLLITFRVCLRRDDGAYTEKQVTKIFDFFNRMQFIKKNKFAFDCGLINKSTYKLLEEFRNKRNLYIHNFLFVPENANIKDVYDLFKKIQPELMDKLIYYYRELKKELDKWI